VERGERSVEGREGQGRERERQMKGEAREERERLSENVEITKYRPVDQTNNFCLSPEEPLPHK
jgi:hypothetical protein